jgi:hypothetical protein
MAAIQSNVHVGEHRPVGYRVITATAAVTHGGGDGVIMVIGVPRQAISSRNAAMQASTGTGTLPPGPLPDAGMVDLRALIDLDAHQFTDADSAICYRRLPT